MSSYDYTVELSNSHSSHTKALNMMEKNIDVLEVGCATGYMTQILQDQYGCRVVAVENDAVAARKASPFCRRLVVGDIEALSPEALSPDGERFDAVLMADVIEHLKNAEAVLDKLKQLLKPDGYFIFSVPNGAHGSVALETLDGKWDYREQGLLDQTHLHFFTIDRFRDLLDGAGLYMSRIERVIIHPRDTEMKTAWDQYPREVTAYIEKVNPEYQTYQFVIKAYCMTDRGWRQGLEDQLAWYAENNRQMEETISIKNEELHRLRAESAGFEKEFEKRQKEYLENLDSETARLEAEKSDIHSAYQSRIDELENESREMHNGYQQQVRDLEAEKEALHRDYGAAIGSLEQEMQTLHRDYGHRLEALEQDKRDRDIHHRREIEAIQQRCEREKERCLLLEAQMTDRIASIDAHANHLAEELATIHNSLAWRIIRRYRAFLEALLPPGSRRHRFYRLCSLAPVVLFREGPSKFIDRIVLHALPGRSARSTRASAPNEAPDSTSSTDGVEPVGPFMRFEHVTISIVIPVFNQLFHTRSCLHSIRLNSTLPYEVIVVDNASSDGTDAYLQGIPNLVHIRNDENLGFVEACNRGAKAARGDYVLLLNNDTEVTPGWLEAMLAPFVDGTVGAVGSKLVYPDGRLQEAGNIIWQDASGWNYGRGDDPGLPWYNYRREVDYCSGACLMVPKTLWEEIGGLDQRFAPAYYEDSDLCFSIRAHGHKVVYQPDAVVIHHEGATAGTDISKGYKRYQQVNLEKFKAKWHDVLAAKHYTGQDWLYLARERGRERRAMVIDHYAPTFDKDSGSMRMFNMIKILNQIKYKVVFWPENRAYNGVYSKTLQEMGVEVMYGDVAFDDYLKDHGRHFDVVIISRPHVAIHFIHAVKAYTEAKVVYDTVDLHFLREERRAAVEKDENQRLQIATLAKEWKNKELFLARAADRVLVVSPVEKELLEKEEGLNGQVAVISNIHSVEDCRNGYAQRNGLMFIGGFRHDPNVDGIIWFTDTIFPKLLARIPDIHLTIVGSHPTENVLALASDTVTVTGYVADVTPYFEQARVFVSPLRYGAGVKGKIGHSLSFGLPVVTTPVGAEGMGLVDGVNAMIASSEHEFVQKVIDVYQDSRLWHSLSCNGRQHIETTFAPEVIREKLQLVCEGDACA